MTEILIILIALWTYPLITLFLVWWTKNRQAIRKKIIWISVFASLTALFGLLTNISTTLSVVDWILVTSIYFTISLLLWLIQFRQKLILKIIAVVGMIIVFGIGYLSSTIGIIGIGFVVNEYTTDTERWFASGMIYKECVLGNAISDYRGKKVEIYKTISWLPIIEWRIKHKEYYNFITCLHPLTVDYRQGEGKIYLTTSALWGRDNHLETWADTLVIK